MRELRELLDMLTKRARVFRADRLYFERNKHMHDITEAPSQEVVDAVLTGFINDIGIMYGVDYALYARDLSQPVELSLREYDNLVRDAMAWRASKK